MDGRDLELQYKFIGCFRYKKRHCKFSFQYSRLKFYVCILGYIRKGGSKMCSSICGYVPDFELKIMALVGGNKRKEYKVAFRLIEIRVGRLPLKVEFNVASLKVWRLQNFI